MGGKMRNRRRIQKLGPMIIFDQDQGLTKAFRNIPGVETMQVDSLNILRLAPGGHLADSLSGLRELSKSWMACMVHGRKSLLRKKDGIFPCLKWPTPPCPKFSSLKRSKRC